MSKKTATKTKEEIKVPETRTAPLTASRKVVAKFYAFDTDKQARVEMSYEGEGKSLEEALKNLKWPDAKINTQIRVSVDGGEEVALAPRVGNEICKDKNVVLLQKKLGV